MAAAQELRVPVIPVDFSDVHFAGGPAELDPLLSAASDYFNSQPCCKEQIRFVAAPPVRLPGTLAHYGANGAGGRDSGLGEAVQKSCRQAAEDGFDFRSFDCDNDGTIDNICFLFAGYAESDGKGEEYFHPCQTLLSKYVSAFMIQGKKVESITVSTEKGPDGQSFADLGTFVHEYAHVLGLPDLYDTDGELSGGVSKALWKSLSLMDGGLRNDCGHTPPFLCAVELDALGSTVTEPLAAGHYSLAPLSRGGKCLYYDGPTSGERYLFECRDNSSRDSFCGTRGLIVYKVDRTELDAGYSDYFKLTLTALERWERNEVNCRPDCSCATVVPARPDAGETAHLAWPQEGCRVLSAASDPSFSFRDGTPSPLALRAISLQADGCVEFDVVEPVVFSKPIVYQDGVLAKWTVAAELGRVEECEVRVSGELVGRVVPVHGGECELSVCGLKAGTDYDLDVSFVTESGEPFLARMPFRTRRVSDGMPPFILLPSGSRLKDGSFLRDTAIPLRICNLGDVERIEWSFEGEKISGGSLTLSRTGYLKAEVWDAVGGKVILLKKIYVK